MKELDRIKNKVAKEWNFKLQDLIIRGQFVTVDQIIDEVAKRYSIVVAENALKEASENATVFPDRTHENGYPMIDKSSITNPKNVKLL